MKKFNPNSLKLLRKLEGLTQSQLAERLDVTVNSVRNYEHARSEPCGRVVDLLWTQFIIPKEYQETINLYEKIKD